MTDLATLPTSVNPAAPATVPERLPGQLWSAAWDAQRLGLVVLVGVYDSHVTVWPVTNESVTPSRPCFWLDSDAAFEPLVCWPEAETGMSSAVLEGCLHHPLSERTVHAIRAWVRGDDELQDLRVCPSRDDEAAMDALTLVCQTAAAWGELDSTDPERIGGGVLSPKFLAENEVNAEMLHSWLGLSSPALTREILAGRRRLAPEQARTIAKKFDTRLDLVWAAPSGPEMAFLRSPEVKLAVITKARELGVSEEDVRFKAWERALVAARQSARGEQAVKQRVLHALESLARPS